MTNQLEPADLTQCQCYPNMLRRDPFSLGPTPAPRRCENSPSYVVRETVHQTDGLCGEMSLCQGCMDLLKTRHPAYDTLDKFLIGIGVRGEPMILPKAETPPPPKENHKHYWEVCVMEKWSPRSGPEAPAVKGGKVAKLEGSGHRVRGVQEVAKAHWGYDLDTLQKIYGVNQ